MKQKILTALLLLTGLTQFAACDIYIDDLDREEDRARAYTISGQWQGDLHMYYTVVNPYTGQAVEFDAYKSYIVFYSPYAGATSGTGKQIDYYDRGPIGQRYHFFRWYIAGGVLHLNFPTDPNLNTSIFDYQLNSHLFQGRIGDSHSVFSLYKLDFYDWENYVGDFQEYPNQYWNW